MTANEDSFERYYTGLTDEALRQVLLDKEDLLPEAALALEREVQRRHLDPSVSRRARFAEGVPEEGNLHSLDESFGYQSLVRRKRFMDRFWWLIAFAPPAALLLSSRYAYRVTENIRLGIAWVVLTVGGWLFLKGRVAAYTCPRCAQRFGSGDSCFFCDLPRTSSAGR